MTSTTANTPPTYPWIPTGSWCQCGPCRRLWCDAAWRSSSLRCWSKRTSSDCARRSPMAATRATYAGRSMDVERRYRPICPTSMLSVLLNASNVFLGLEPKIREESWLKPGGGWPGANYSPCSQIFILRKRKKEINKVRWMFEVSDNLKIKLIQFQWN